MAFYATIPVTAELSQTILADPYLKRGDMVWDSDFTGVYEVTLAPTKGDPISNFFEWLGDLVFGDFIGTIILILIGIVGLYIFIKIGIPYIRMRQRRKVIHSNRTYTHNSNYE